MNRVVKILTALLSLLLLAAQFSAVAQEDTIAKTNLKVGDVAPDFTLLANDWKPVKLSDFRGKKNVDPGLLRSRFHRWLNARNCRPIRLIWPSSKLATP